MLVDPISTFSGAVFWIAAIPTLIAVATVVVGLMLNRLTQKDVLGGGAGGYLVAALVGAFAWAFLVFAVSILFDTF